MPAIEVRNVSKNYPLSGSQIDRMRRVLWNAGGEGIWVLRDVTFTVGRGEAFGIIGSNGAGKSTLLQIVAGILRPTSGTAEVHGRLSALLELGSGFSPEFAGRDNVFLNGSILGFSREDMAARFAEIERFAEIGDFMDQPVRTYSSGMVARLAFAVAAHTDPEVLVVDEALAVGDIAFRQRCMRRIHDLRERGTTIVFVSHETGDIKALCDRCLWLDRGRVQMIGEPDEVVAHYLARTVAAEPNSSLRRAEGRNRFGDGRASVVSASLDHVGDRCTLMLVIAAHTALDSPVAGFLVRNLRGEIIFGTNTAREDRPIPPLHPGEERTIAFHWSSKMMLPGEYTISTAVVNGVIDSFEVCDFADEVLPFRIPGDPARNGYIEMPCSGITVY